MKDILDWNIHQREKAKLVLAGWEERNKVKIGFIGTGVMGSRMVKRLLVHGYQVGVYNRTTVKARALEELGAISEASISSLASNYDAICTCLSMPEDVLEVYGGQHGIMENARPGTICIDLTTVGPDTSRAIFAKAAEKEVAYLDAPVSGGPEGAETGTLTIMVGGEQEAFETVSSILHVLGGTVEYLGSSGSGSIAKLINQYLVAVHSLAASEAMVAGAAYGLESQQLFNILKVSYGDSRILRRHMEQYVFDRNFQPGGAVKYVLKDVRLANQLLQGAGMDIFTGQLAEQAFSDAATKGLNDLDMSAVIQPLEEQCGVVVKKNS
jgi:3-hydroxyisobutyrate dehydrogenase